MRTEQRRKTLSLLPTAFETLWREPTETIVFTIQVTIIDLLYCISLLKVNFSLVFILLFTHRNKKQIFLQEVKYIGNYLFSKIIKDCYLSIIGNKIREIFS